MTNLGYVAYSWLMSPFGKGQAELRVRAWFRYIIIIVYSTDGCNVYYIDPKRDCFGL